MASAKIELFIDESLNLNILSVQANGRELTPITVALSSLFNNPNGAPELLLGKAILGHLRVVDRDKFEKPLDDNKDREDDFDEDFFIVQRLIAISVTERTKVIVPAIDYILQRIAINNGEAKLFWVEAWPGIRERIEGFE